MLAGAAVLLGCPAAGQSLPPSQIDELMRGLASVPETRADFTEEKTIAALAAPVRSEGWLAYRRPGHLEKTTTAPVPESLMVDGERLSILAVDQDPKVIDLDSQPALRAMVDAVRGTLSGDLPRLRRSYQVAMAGGPSGWRLTLTPIAPELARLLREVIVDGTETSLRAVRIVHANGDQSLMTIRPTS